MPRFEVFMKAEQYDGSTLVLVINRAVRGTIAPLSLVQIYASSAAYCLRCKQQDCCHIRFARKQGGK